MIGHLCRWGEQCDEFVKWHSIMKRRVCVFDNGGKTVDRYSVLIQRTGGGRKVLDIYSMSKDALSGLGVNQFSHSAYNPFKDFEYLGKRIQVQDLPKDVITAIEDRL